MTTKIKITAGDISLDVEGDEATVLEIYRDFKGALTARATATPSASAGAMGNDDAGDEGGVDEGAAAKPKRRAARRRPSANSGEKRAESYVPSLDKTLKTPGIRDYYGKWDPKNHPEKVLIFVEYLKSQGHDPCTADQIFTCYQAAGVIRPKAFRQAIIDTQGQKFGYIDYKSYTDISSTSIGEDYLNFTMKKAGAAAK